jgi:hypothetical protein
MVVVAWKLNMIEERRQQQTCLLQTGDYRNKFYNPDKN